MIRIAKDLGDLVRQRRKHLNLTQDELAARCGVGKRFILELEAGKPSCQLQKALIAAYEVGLRLDDLSRSQSQPQTSSEDDPLADLPRF
jgi:HTH-type transcriptional regulator / antitoxin HipB